jgi:hypothetical protein
LKNRSCSYSREGYNKKKRTTKKKDKKNDNEAKLCVTW